MITVKYDPAKYKLVPLEFPDYMVRTLRKNLYYGSGYANALLESIKSAPLLSELTDVEVIE